MIIKAKIVPKIPIFLKLKLIFYTIVTNCAKISKKVRISHIIPSCKNNWW